MDTWVMAMMLGVSLFMGALSLFAFLWAVKNGHFDDKEKFLNAVKFDNQEDLNDAILNDKKKEEFNKKHYKAE